MVKFFNKDDKHKSKINMIKEFEKTVDNQIYEKEIKDLLKITSYNVHYFLQPNKSADSLSSKLIQKGIKNLLSFCKKSKSDVILLQEAIFNEHIISLFRQNDYTVYVCDTYEIVNKEKEMFYYGNVILINSQNDNIKIKTVSKTLSLSGFHKRKKCLVNIVIEYFDHTISIYNIHLDVWDRTGKCRLEQIKHILHTIAKDKYENILIAGDFNAIKESDYSKSEANALKQFYSTYTSNPFKEIAFLESKKFTDVATFFKEKISQTVWSKQRVDFFFIRQGFSLPIVDYEVQKIKGSDHFPISIQLFAKKKCLTLDLMHKKLIIKPDKIKLHNSEPIYRKLVYSFKNEKECPVVVKILPIWNQKWRIMKNIIYNSYISNSYITYGMNASHNEATVTKYMSKLVENQVTFNFIKTIAIYESEILPIPHDKQKKFHLLDIPNQKFYIIVQPHLEHCIDNQQFSTNPDLIVFLLQWSLFIAFDKYKFVHGDILEGSDNSVLCHTFQFFGKQFCIVKYENLIWKFPLIEGKIPCVIMFDFGFSEFTYGKYKINNIVPFTTPEQFPLGSPKLLEEKRKQDILGLNIVLKKIGIEKQIPFVKTSSNKHLLNNFDNYKITEKQFNELDPNIYFLFDGTAKKI